MRVLLIAERMNLSRRPSLDLREEQDPHRWLEVSVRIGCFGTGISVKGGRGERRLREIGLVWHDALNLLPPSPVCGAWNEYRARRVCDAMADLFEAAYRTVDMTGDPCAFTLHKGMTLERWALYNYIVLLGRKVEAAMGLRNRPYFEPLLTGDGLHGIIVAPHPSGLNRWWNDPANIERARQQLSWMSTINSG